MNRENQTGFTVVELLIAVAIAGILSTVLLAVSLGFTADVFRSRATAELAVESHFVLQAMIEDVRLADGVSATNTITDANAPSGGWTTSSSLDRIVINSPAVDSDRNIIYDAGTGFSYSNQLVWFRDDSTLYRRTLKETAAAGNVMVTSCPEESSSSSCPPDKVYSQYLKDLEFTYYDVDNAVTTDPLLARSLKISITLERNSYGKPITLTNSIQATLRNY